ncbi:MAG: Hsp20/alpha crystallin family protein [Gemmatimonadota bacterium]|nr:Hsp20/alpha crystallin family protein [Gemmatimonadota bacterium]
MLFESSLSPLPMFGLRRDMNRLLDDMITRGAPNSAWAPPVDVCEDGNGIAISLELAGVEPGDVEVTSDNGLLTIKGIKSADRKEGDEYTQWHLVERSYGTFMRSFRLPKGIDDGKIAASYDHGVLTIHVPKTALPQPKKISIDTTTSRNGRVENGSSGSQAKVGA